MLTTMAFTVLHKKAIVSLSCEIEGIRLTITWTAYLFVYVSGAHADTSHGNQFHV